MNTPSKRYTVGLLGAGYICRAHAKALGAVAEADLRWICDTSRSRARAIAAEFGAAERLRLGDGAGSPPIATSSTSCCRRICTRAPPSSCCERGQERLHRKAHGPERGGVPVARRRLPLPSGLQLGVNHNFLFMPGYESLRRDAKDGSLGPLDQVTINWLYALGLLQFGPYDNWMRRVRRQHAVRGRIAPRCVRPRSAGRVDRAARHRFSSDRSARRPTRLRHWHAWAERGDRLRRSIFRSRPGQPERSMHVRGCRGAAHLDFERNLYWRERSRSNSAHLRSAAHGAAHGAPDRRAGLARTWSAISARDPSSRAARTRLPGKHLAAASPRSIAASTAAR